jgi:hypothetical protein
MKETALTIAHSSLLRKSLREIAIETGAEIGEGDVISIPYFNTIEKISLPDCTFEPEIGEIEKVLVLRYLCAKIPDNENETWTSFENLPGGMFYNRTFERRGQERIRKAFENRGTLLVDAAAALGGVSETFADVSVLIPVFPRARVLVTLAFGDEEFGSDAKILVKRTIADIMSLEDVAFLADVVAKKLCAFISE